MPRHIFFDLDNTLMLSRTEMAAQHRPLFKQLCDMKDVVVVSGAKESQIRAQIPDSIGAKFYMLGQTGNHALDKGGATLWKEVFTDPQTDATLIFIDALKGEFALAVRDPDDLVELRGSQISYRPIGHHEALEKKYAFDPKTQLRRAIIERHAAEIQKLNMLGIDVVPGGTTCFDFFLLGKNKGFNVGRLIELQRWSKDECVYVGDALFPGGNDETVVGVVPTHPVKDPDETFEFIAKTLLA